MKFLLVALLLSASQAPSWANFNATGDSQVTGQVGVGTQQPQARMQVQMAPSDTYALLVSSQNGAPLLSINNSGNMGLGTQAPQAHLDVYGSGDSGSTGLQLRAGNSPSPGSAPNRLHLKCRALRACHPHAGHKRAEREQLDRLLSME